MLHLLTVEWEACKSVHLNLKLTHLICILFINNTLALVRIENTQRSEVIWLTVRLGLSEPQLKTFDRLEFVSDTSVNESLMLEAAEKLGSHF